MIYTLSGSAPIADIVLARRLMAGGWPQADFTDRPAGGALRSITWSVEAADASSARLYGVERLREVLGSVLQGQVEITSVTPDDSHVEGKPIAVGDSFPLDERDVGDCPATVSKVPGAVAFCVLDEGHRGQHVATDGETVVEVWD